MENFKHMDDTAIVGLRAGAWIEIISTVAQVTGQTGSLSVRERGLKYQAQ